MKLRAKRLFATVLVVLLMLTCMTSAMAAKKSSSSSSSSVPTYTTRPTFQQTLAASQTMVNNAAENGTYKSTGNDNSDYMQRNGYVYDSSQTGRYNYGVTVLPTSSGSSKPPQSPNNPVDNSTPDTYYSPDYGGGTTNWSYDPPPPAPCDLTVTNIAPLMGYKEANTITAITVKNECTETRSGVLVEFSANGQKYAKTVSVSANSTATAYFRWVTPNAESALVTARVNPMYAITETDYTNNAKEAVVALKGMPTKQDPIEPTDVPVIKIPDPIPGENVTEISWEGTDPDTGKPKIYHAWLKINAAFDQTQMKSGYGFKCKARVTVTTDCPDPEAVLKAQQVVMYVPEYRYTSAVRLESSDYVIWELPVNATSHYGYRRWYVPVWFPDDKNYTVVVQALGAMTPGGELKGSCPVSLYIKGNMYEDDVTYIEYARY